MALNLIKEDGSGLASANSYSSAADGEAYHDAHCYASAWTHVTVANKEKALVIATRLIDASYEFNAWKRGSVQALQWPREAAVARVPGQGQPIVLVAIDHSSSGAIQTMGDPFDAHGGPGASTARNPRP